MKDPAVTKYFTDRFLNNYGAPDVVDPKAFVEEYHRALAGTSEPVLKAAADLVVDKHTFRNWPLVGECKKAVVEILERREEARARQQAYARKPEPVRATTTDEQRANVAALVKAATQRMHNIDQKVNAQSEKREWVKTDKKAWADRLRRSDVARSLAIEPPPEYYQLVDRLSFKDRVKRRWNPW